MAAEAAGTSIVCAAVTADIICGHARSYIRNTLSGGDISWTEPSVLEPILVDANRHTEMRMRLHGDIAEACPEIRQAAHLA